MRRFSRATKEQVKEQETKSERKNKKDDMKENQNKQSMKRAKKIDQIRKQSKNRKNEKKDGKSTPSQNTTTTKISTVSKPKKIDCTNLGSAEGGGNSPSAAKFSFARHGPCLRKDPALRCPRRSSLDSSKWVRSVPRRNSRNPPQNRQ